MISGRRIAIAWTVLAIAFLFLAPVARPAEPAADGMPQLLAALKGDDEQAKAIACKRLAVVGTKDAVPALIPLLADPKFGHYARFALEAIPDPAVDDALRQALGQLKGRALVGVIDSIGVRRDVGAVEPLAARLADNDPEVASAAVGALGRMGTPTTAKILMERLPQAGNLVQAVSDAVLDNAEGLRRSGQTDAARDLYDALRKADLPKHHRVAALRGSVLLRGTEAALPIVVSQLTGDDKALSDAAFALIRQLKGEAVSAALLGLLPKLPPQRQAQAIAALGDRRDSAALNMINEAAKSGEPAVRLAAIQALKKLGNASSLPVLLEAAFTTDAELAKAAQDVLVVLPGNEANDALLALARQGQGEAARRTVLINLLGERRTAAAVPVLLAAANDADPQVRIAAITALGSTAGAAELPGLVTRMTSGPSPEEKKAALDAVRATAVRMPDRDAAAAALVAVMATLPAEGKVAILEVLQTLGGAKALETMAQAAKSADGELQDPAFRLLGEWMEPAAAPVLLDLAKTSENVKYRVRAMRGYIRIIRQLDLAPNERLEMARTAMQAANRPDEKRLVLEAVTRAPSPASLEFVSGYLGEKGLGEQASAAAIVIAESLSPKHPAELAKAMEQVLAVTKNRDLQARAKMVQAGLPK